MPVTTKRRTAPTPDGIDAAMRQGAANAEINRLVAQGVLRRPRLSEALRSWSSAGWREARRRGLIW